MRLTTLTIAAAALSASPGRSEHVSWGAPGGAVDEAWDAYLHSRFSSPPGPLQSEAATGRPVPDSEPHPPPGQWAAQVPLQPPAKEEVEPSYNLWEAMHAMEAGKPSPPGGTGAALRELVGAVEVLQERFFESWRGTWPRGIDWTRAVLGTQVSGALRTASAAGEFLECGAAAPPAAGAGPPPRAATENRVARHFSEVSAFYFGENALDLRGQAFDDMLWVVLGWLEATRLVSEHEAAHFAGADEGWFARHFVRGFAHRSRVFWDLARQGWDTRLCGGGMTWNPRLKPYKNAITNELFIAASVGMYLHSPGDDIGFPFDVRKDDLPEVGEHDEEYLRMAIKGYDWLMASNMTNGQGLFVDGYHARRGSTDCDERNENVFTYNQGVILSGHRGLWEATGNASYLADGHALVRNVVRATGFDAAGAHSPAWSGLGRFGIIEETCDAEGRCSQDGHTFKGIFFHHLAAFCQPLPVGPNRGVFHRADRELAHLHRSSCQGYAAWVARQARAALGTRDEHGVFGTWWLIGEVPFEGLEPARSADPENDYRNRGVPRNDRWMLPEQLAQAGSGPREPVRGTPTDPAAAVRDPNDRGRGRTPETQSGGIAVVKALYLFADLMRDVDNEAL